MLLPAFFITLWSQPAGHLAGDDVVSLRVRFGLTDQTPQSWDGSLECTNGEVRMLRNWNPHPSEEIVGRTAWKLATRQGLNYRRRVYQEENPEGTVLYLYHPGLVVDVWANSGTRLDFITSQGHFTVWPSRLRVAEESIFLKGAVRVDRVASAERISSSDYENDFATILGGEGEVWAAWTAYRNGAVHVMARRFFNGGWQPPMEVAQPGDIYRVQLARAADGKLWAVWSEQVEGNFDLYGRAFDGSSWSTPVRLTDSPHSDVEHRMISDSGGRIWLVWQSFRSGQADIFARSHNGGRWTQVVRLSESSANDWSPAVAVDAAGSVYVAWDTYDNGNYDVVFRRYSGDGWGELEPIAATPRFEGHVSLACDARNRLWAAWNVSGFEWGKDTGFLVHKKGTSLYEWRAIQVGVFENGRLLEPITDPNEALPTALVGSNDFPILHKDSRDRMWLFFRHRTLRIRDVPNFTPAHRAAWEIYGSVYAAESWSQPLHLPFSRGRQDVRWGITTASKGRLWAAWPTDFRDSDSYLFQKAEVHAGPLPPLEGHLDEPRLRERVEREVQTYPIHPNESENITRIRNYKIISEGKTYRIYRGDTHRHTEFSHDGMWDGSLLETYRYALDAARLDYLGVSDHSNNGGQEIEYINWILPQIAEVFHIPTSFVTIFTYERGVGYPNGHRNVLTAKRGIPALPIPQPERRGDVGAGELYQYLKKYDAIAISHTSATNMGTDWRDNDPEVEPLVEIYQGDRVSAEYAGAPRAANESRPQTQIGGYRPKGFVWNAWAKGYKLGVQASSDHLSTHISYACTIAEEYTREGLLNAMRKRHSYAATDNIVLDYRLKTNGREYLQGDILETSEPFRLWIKVLGTADIRQIDIIKNNNFIYSRQMPGRDLEFTFVDSQPSSGQSYYYVRVQQIDDEMAWSSPIWVAVN